MFILLLLVSGTVLFFSRWIQNSLSLPPQSFAVGIEIFRALQRALSFTLYGTVLVSLSYSVRKNVGALPTLIVITLSGTLLSGGITEGLKTISASPVSATMAKLLYQPKALGEPGLIRAYTTESGVTVQAVLGDSGIPQGSVIVMEGTKALRKIDFPAPGTVVWKNPFEQGTLGTIRTLEEELFLSSDRLFRRADQGWLDILVFALTLSFFLASFQFVLRLTAWPLANLFLGALLFRFLVFFEQAIYSEEGTQFIGVLSQGLLPESMVTPVALVALGSLLNIYSLLLYLAQDRRSSHGKR